MLNKYHNVLLNHYLYKLFKFKNIRFMKNYQNIKIKLMIWVKRTKNLLILGRIFMKLWKK
jgi:hypothetical protein